MSKTYLDQLAKAQNLADGLTRHADWAKSKGIDSGRIQEMEKLIKEGQALNAQVEQLREEAKKVAAVANERLAAVKERYNAMKAVVKQNVNQDKWLDYGVQDKR